MAKTRITKLDFVKQHDIHYYHATGVDNITLQSSNNNPCSSYKKGMIIYFIANGENTGSIHFTIDELALKEAVRFDGSLFKGGEIKKGSPYIWIFNGEQFQLLGSELSEVEKNIATLVERLDTVDKELLQLQQTADSKINKTVVDELLGEFKNNLESTDKKIEEVKKELIEMNSNTKEEIEKSITTLKENIKTAFEKAGTDVASEIKKTKSEIISKYREEIKNSEIKTIFGKEFDITAVEEYEDGKEYKNNTIVKYNGDYAIIIEDELYLTGIKY